MTAAVAKPLAPLPKRRLRAKKAAAVEQAAQPSPSALPATLSSTKPCPDAAAATIVPAVVLADASSSATAPLACDNDDTTPVAEADEKPGSLL